MRRKTTCWLIAAAFLIVVGSGLFTAAMMAYNWDFTELSTSEYETNTHEITETFHRISIDTDTADLSFVPSADKTCHVVCLEDGKAQHTVSVQDGTLTIQLTDARMWYEKIGISHRTPNITVYLPDREYDTLTIRESTGDIEIPKDFRFEDLDIRTSTGDVELEAVSADTLRISVTTGDVNLTDCSCLTLLSNGDTGEINLKNTIIEETLSIERSTGDVTFDSCDAAEISVITDTGDVRGSFLTDKVFLIQTDTGHVDIPDTLNGGTCEITTTTGDIKLEILHGRKEWP